VLTMQPACQRDPATRLMCLTIAAATLVVEQTNAIDVCTFVGWNDEGLGKDDFGRRRIITSSGRRAPAARIALKLTA
jgi:hypothetical protein